jgi:outer membrane protein OmpA-like peptidoglycan-associated protein
MKVKNLLLLSLLFGAALLLNAQTADKKVAIGLSGVLNEYNGDYGNGIFKFKNFYPAAGLSFSTYLNSSFDLGLQGSYGNYGFKETADDQFYGMKLDASLFTHYKLNNGYIFSKKAKLSPFLSLGVGCATYSLSPNDKGANPAIIKDGLDVIVPVGAGLKLQISNGFAIQYQYLYTITNKDNHDQNRGADYFGSTAHLSSKSGNDAYGQNQLSFIFSLGKLKDLDKDGVADKYDKCLGTPAGVKVDNVGCPVDTDGDGVPDYLDKCKNTPEGVLVDAKGCPKDADGDGVPDYLDKCPGTLAAAYGKVDEKGCPIDTDGDGVPDYLDMCPGTPAEARGFIDIKGCPIDTDGDGVPDYLDKCPNTAAAAIGKVDKNGCPLDTDGDGIADYLDKCPKVAGTEANNGCPEVKKEVKTLFKKALQGIQFETGKATIIPTSFLLLDQIANTLILNPTYLIEVQGHTDNVGNPEKNLALSKDRAAAVRDYLISKGVNEKSVTSQGFGDMKPVADNKTKAGKAQNRRVEFEVTFEQ